MRRGSCEVCLYFDDQRSECRRRAPLQGGRMDFFIREALRTIALSQEKISQLGDSAIRQESFEAEEHDLWPPVNDAIRQDSSEVEERDLWPRVNANDWCGEFELSVEKEKRRRSENFSKILGRSGSPLGWTIVIILIVAIVAEIFLGFDPIGKVLWFIDNIFHLSRK